MKDTRGKSGSTSWAFAAASMCFFCPKTCCKHTWMLIFIAKMLPNIKYIPSSSLPVWSKSSTHFLPYLWADDSCSSPIENSTPPSPTSPLQPKGNWKEWIFLHHKSYILSNTVKEFLMCLGSLCNQPSLREVKYRQCPALLKACC